jgi:hypothetical protein
MSKKLAARWLTLVEEMESNQCASRLAVAPGHAAAARTPAAIARATTSVATASIAS